VLAGAYKAQVLQKKTRQPEVKPPGRRCTMPKNNYDDDEDDDLLMALQSMEPCANCGAEGAKVPCMSGCGEVFYCSRVRRRVTAAREKPVEQHALTLEL
jgi:hypothetical protein